VSSPDVESLPLDELDVITAARYGTRGYPHAEWARLRRESPVHRFAPPGYEPFWAITKHADVVSISKRPDRFRSAGRFILLPELDLVAEGQSLAENPPLRMLVNMDPPEHRDYRRLISAWFTPRAVRRLEARLDEITCEVFDELGAGGPEFEVDFVRDVAARQPLRMITEMLGIPREDEDFVLRVTNENFGLEDPEFRREGETRDERLGFLREAAEYLQRLLADRRARPRDDLTTVLAHARLNGGPVPPFELFSLFFLVMVAGHDTTRNAISGGLLALLDHPGEFERLRRDPGLVSRAADEIVRFTSPVIHFVRTAVEDCEIRGQRIRAGDSLALFYPSANRDEEVFEDPFSFRVDREPNPHLGFGIGEHFCLGASLARLDLQVFFRHLARRVEHVELAGPVDRLHASFVGGPKRIPVRGRIRPA